MSAISRNCSVKPHHRRINIVRAIKALSAAAMLLTPALVQTTALATRTTQGVSNIPLNAQDAMYSVYNFYNLQGLLNDSSLTNADLINYLSTLPGFYSDTPTIYRFIPCGNGSTINGVSNYQSVLNIAGAETFSNPTNDWLQNERNFSFYNGGNFSGSSALGGRAYVPPGYVVYNTQPIELCAAYIGKPPFFYPTATAANSNPTVTVSTGGIATLNLTQDDPASDYLPYASGGYVARTGNLTQPLTVRLQFGGSSVLGTDYAVSYRNAAGQVVRFTNGPVDVVIPVGFAGTFIYVDWLTRFQNQPEKDLVISAVAPMNYLIGTLNSLVNRTLPVNIPNVTFAISSEQTLNSGSVGKFTATRAGGDLTQALTVVYTTDGTAVNGTDYSFLDGSIVIPANQSSVTMDFTIPARSGSVAVPEKSIVIQAQDTGNAYNLGSAAPLNYIIGAYSPSSISVGVENNGTANRGETSDFMISRDPNGDLSQPLTVNYTLSGTATPGTDYRTSSSGKNGSVTIPAGESTATVPVTVPPESGTIAKPEKEITLSVAPGNGYGLPNPAPSGSLTIPAYSPSAIVLSNDGDGFTFTRPATDAGKPLTISYELDGTATNGPDYRVPGNSSGSITIPAGQTSATLPVDVKPNSGSAYEPEETIVLRLKPGSGYDDAATQPSTITIPSYTPLSGSTSSNPPAFILTRPGESDLSKPVEVLYQVSGGSGQFGKDYGMPASGTITIPAGQTVGSLPIQVLPTAEAGKTVSVTLTSPAGHGLGNPSLSYTIQDADIAKKAPVELMGTVQPDGGLLITRPAEDKDNQLDLPYTVTLKHNDGKTELVSGSLPFAPGVESNSIPASALPQVSKEGGTISYDVQPPQGYSIDDSRLVKTIGAKAQPGPSVPQVGVTTDNDAGSDNGGGNGSGNNNTGNNSANSQLNPSFTVDRKPGTDINQPVTIQYEVGGTAIPGLDYVALPGSVTIPSGKSSVTTQIKLLTDPSELAGKTIRIRLLDGAEYDLAAGQGSGQISLNRRPSRPNGNGNGNGGSTTVTGSTSNSNDDDNSNGGGSSSAALVAVPVVGALGAGVAAAMGAFGGGGLLANACPANYSLPGEVVQLAQQVDTDGTVNWESISFSVLPQVDKKPAAMAFTLGQFGDDLGKMSLKNIAEVTGQDMSGMTLSALLGLNPAAKVSDIPGLAEHIAALDGTANKQNVPIAATTPVTAETALSMLLAQRPAMRSMTLAEIDGVMELELQSIGNWQQIPVGQLPGLAEASFDKLFPCLVQPEDRQAVMGDKGLRNGVSGDGRP